MKISSASLWAAALATAGSTVAIADPPLLAGANIHDNSGTASTSSTALSGSVHSSEENSANAFGSSSVVSWQTQANGTADAGILRATSRAHVNNFGTGFAGSDYVFSYSGNSSGFGAPGVAAVDEPGGYSSGHWDGIMFSAPAGSLATTVTATFHLSISGLLLTSTVNSGGPNLGISASAAVDVSAFLNSSYFVPGTSFGGGAFGVQRISQGAGAPATESSGLLVGAVFDGSTANDLVLGPFVFPVGQPVSLDIKLKTAARASSYGFYQVDAVSDFGHTLELPVGSPVFDLPAGFSVDSTELGIVNDMFTPVPEPRDYAFSAGICCIGLVLWRRHGLTSHQG